MSEDGEKPKAESRLTKARREAAELALQRSRLEIGRAYPALQDPAQAVREAKAAQRKQAVRARHLALNDRDEKVRLAARKAAQLEVKRGVYVNLDDAVEGPTEEWLAKGDVAPFTPKQLAGTVRTEKSVRRVQRGQIEIAYLTNRLTDEQFAAALWFRDIHEQAGMTGRWPTVQLDRHQSSGGGAGQSPLPMHEWEAYCREHYHNVMKWIDPFYHQFWEAVVIHNLAMRAATRLARCRNVKVFNRLTDICDTVAAYCSFSRIKLKLGEVDDLEVEGVMQASIMNEPG